MRDTDADWQHIGASQPYYGVLTATDYLTENMNDEHRQSFYQQGINEVDALISSIRARFGEFSPRKAIDFGCGVGRLTHAMASHAGEVIGVDIAPGMIEKARIGAPTNAHFQQVIPNGPIDWISSLIVFQHIPPARGYALFEKLLAQLAPGGVISMHFAIYKSHANLGHAISSVTAAAWDGETMRVYREEEPPVGAILLYDYDLTRLFAIANAAGIHSMYIDHINHDGHHAAILYGKKVG
jgi:trans-aconitate methyltransferase